MLNINYKQAFSYYAISHCWSTEVPQLKFNLSMALRSKFGPRTDIYLFSQTIL